MQPIVLPVRLSLYGVALPVKVPPLPPAGCVGVAVTLRIVTARAVAVGSGIGVEVGGTGVGVAGGSCGVGVGGSGVAVEEGGAGVAVSDSRGVAAAGGVDVGVSGSGVSVAVGSGGIGVSSGVGNARPIWGVGISATLLFRLVRGAVRGADSGRATGAGLVDSSVPVTLSLRWTPTATSIIASTPQLGGEINLKPGSQGARTAAAASA
jgi:hypothetical protein